MTHLNVSKNTNKKCHKVYLQQQTNSTAAIWMKRHLLWQFTVKIIESTSESHWHKECPNASIEVTL